jgi:hypothetical protein
MARSHRQLTVLSVTRKKQAGYYSDGDGLYLQITSSGAKSWLYRYMLAGRRREMGLGSLGDVSLAEARAKATTARQLAKSGLDPIDARNTENARQRLEEARSITFDEAARLYIADHGRVAQGQIHTVTESPLANALSGIVLGSHKSGHSGFRGTAGYARGIDLEGQCEGRRAVYRTSLGARRVPWRLPNDFGIGPQPLR